MTAPRRSLVVLTPVKNEAWILDRFLAVCSRFADLILIADQMSTDGSREIAARWPKVRLIDNASPVYDEAERQKLLIQTARELVPGPRILLALDADEMLAADSLDHPDWRTFLDSPPGTVLMLEKADLYPTADECLRYTRPFPYGYVDDDAPHQARWIHSYRVPVRPESPTYAPDGIKLLHYAHLRPRVQRIKTCMYIILESRKAPANPKSILSRRHNYGRKMDWIGIGRREKSVPGWFRGWEEQGIDMRTVGDTDEPWQAWAALEIIGRLGPRALWLEDIWDVDWERLRRRGIERGIPGVPTRPIVRPPAVLRWLLDAVDAVIRRVKG